MRKRCIHWCVAIALVVVARPGHAAIFFSQYYEGASFNRWVELYNAGPTTVDLAAEKYTLALYPNTTSTSQSEAWKTATHTTASTLTLSLVKEIPAGGTLLIYHGSASGPAYTFNGGDERRQFSTPAMNFTGDDSLVLWKGNSYSIDAVVDVIGMTTSSSFTNTSLVRKGSIHSGTKANLNLADWTQMDYTAVDGATANTVQYLGYHAITAAPVPEPVTLGAGVLVSILTALRRPQRMPVPVDPVIL